MEEEEIIKRNVETIESRIDAKLKEIDRMMGKTTDEQPPPRELKVEKQPSPLVQAGMS